MLQAPYAEFEEYLEADKYIGREIDFNILMLVAKKSKSFKDLENNLGFIGRGTLNRIFKYHNIIDN